jgi:uncharacterized repeat protein (TIGR03803 family)
LVQGRDGYMYGTTQGGGLYGQGAIFKIDREGCRGLLLCEETVLYSFCSQYNGTTCLDGADPQSGLTLGSDGNFYGVTAMNGPGPEEGEIFRITPEGTFTVLHGFDGVHGAYPVGALVQATDGNFYGTTEGDGYGANVIFSLSVGLPPFVKTLPTAGNVGETVRILGTNLIGATKVLFNGHAAAFKVASSSLITAVVPNGATTGPVEVVTPGGTLLSNVPFQILTPGILPVGLLPGPSPPAPSLPEPSFPPAA